MLNFNSLYNTVFNPEYPPFDSTKDYYTVVFDTPGFGVLYQEVESRLKSMMSEEAYTYYHSENDSDIERSKVEERLSEIAEMIDVRIQGAPPARRYCLLAYFDENNRDFGNVINLLRSIKRETKDVVTLLVCLSKELKGKNAFLKEMAFALKENAPYVDWYIFSDFDTKYYRRLLIYSICGVIINGTTLVLQGQRNGRRDRAEMAVSNYINTQLSEEGRAFINEHPDMRWSTACYKYYDHQYDFLCKYVMDTCNNLQKIGRDNFFEILDRIYESFVPVHDSVRVSNLLEKTIMLMPYVVSNLGKGTEIELRDYYRIAYGDRGPASVELTLKTTLAALYRYDTDGIIAECGRRIFTECSSFADANVYDTVCQLLKQRIEELNSSCNSINGSIKVILNECVTLGDHRDIQKKYLDKYAQLYVKQKEVQFWSDVLDSISKNPAEYTEHCKLSSDCFREIENLKKSLPAATPYDNLNIRIIPLNARDILEIDKNDAVCKHIRDAFTVVNSEKDGKNPPESCSAVFDMNLDPNFFRGEMANYSNAAYELCGLELNGRYLVSLGGESDV